MELVLEDPDIVSEHEEYFYGDLAQGMIKRFARERSTDEEVSSPN